MDFYSPLRYPGGKGKVADYFKKVFIENSLCDGVYVEPYAGGASVALSLMFSEYASKIVINDKDRSLYAFWYSVLHETDELCRLIKDCSITVKNWERQRLIQKTKNDHELLKLGFSTFFLNRVNRSGIIMAGIIGGKEQSGNWKMDARFNKSDLIKRITRIAKYSERIKLYNKDAISLIKHVEKTLPKKSLLYLDPPYFDKGKELYMNHYLPKDHERIATFMGELQNRNWIVSYDGVAQIMRLYSQFRQVQYTINYSAGKTDEGSEIMVYSNDIKIPDADIFKTAS